MHIEKNVFDNIIHTVMNNDRTKDNEKAMMDLEEYYRHPELNLQPSRDSHWSKLKTSYTLSFVQRQDVCKWMQELRMPNSYALNLDRCVNVAQRKFFGMKSHDYHIFMECLLPIALRELSDHVQRLLTKLSEYFRDFCSSTLKVDDLLVMKKNIPIILCKLEKIFPPFFF